MTLIIGVWCEDGIVIGADSSVTYPTRIRQEVSDKIELQADDVIVAASGPVGLSQQFKGQLRDSWRQVRHDPSITRVKDAISGALLPHIEQAKLQANLRDRKFEGCNLLIALQIDGFPHLLSYSSVAEPTSITPDITFRSFGAGELQADPFMAFIKRVIWSSQSPRSTEDGIFGVLWTLRHVSLVNAGLGVGGKPRIAVLKERDNGWTAETISEERIDEHQQSIVYAEDELRDFRNRFLRRFEEESD